MSEEKELGAPISFYNGEETLRFDKDGWKWYRVDGEKLEPLDGVTGIVHILDKSFYLMPWACKMMAQKILRTMPHILTSESEKPSHTESLPVEKFAEIVNAAKTAHREKLEDAGDIGGMAHEWIESAIRWAISFNHGVVSEMPALAPIDERAVNCGLAAWEWMKAHNVRFKSTERPIYSRIHRYAGTCDGTALVDSCDNPACCARIFQDELSIIDWKTSNYLHVEFLYQTAAYQNALQEEFPENKYHARWILRLGKEAGDFSSWYERDFDSDFGGYMACLTLSRIHKKIEKRMAVQKKMLTTRKKSARLSEKEEEKKNKKSRAKRAD